MIFCGSWNYQLELGILCQKVFRHIFDSEINRDKTRRRKEVDSDERLGSYFNRVGTNSDESSLGIYLYGKLLGSTHIIKYTEETLILSSTP